MREFCRFFTQVLCKGIPVKKRRAIHMVEHGGCGLTWNTVELPENMLNQINGK